MTSWTASARALAVGAALLGACSGDDPVAPPSTTAAPATSDSTTTSTSAPPPRPVSTTTTAYDASTVEGQIEAAYLRSWDVYADAVYNLELDEAALAEVYAGEGLGRLLGEVEGRISQGRAALVRIDHAYEIVVTDQEIASVVDRITNHQVLIDPVTRKPIEDDPNEVQVLNFVMNLLDGAWKVVRVERVG